MSEQPNESRGPTVPEMLQGLSKPKPGTNPEKLMAEMVGGQWNTGGPDQRGPSDSIALPGGGFGSSKAFPVATTELRGSVTKIK